MHSINGDQRPNIETIMDLPPLHFYPIAVSILFPATFISTYIIAVVLEHTEVKINEIQACKSV